MTDEVFPYWTLQRASDPAKKWAVRVPTASGRGKIVEFGATGYEDFTTHKDVERRERYRTRHQRDRLDDPYAPGFWSMWALWGESSNLKVAFADAVARAKQILGQHAMPRKNPIAPKSRKETQAYPVREQTGFHKETLRGGGFSPPSSGRFFGQVPLGAEIFYLGTVVNPRTMRPYFVVATGNEGDFAVIVPSFNLNEIEIVGKGYLESDEDSQYAAPANMLGMPRVHTPGGIPKNEQSSGLGTVLYTAGALYGSYLAAGLQEGAAAEDYPGVRDNDPEHSGVSSGHGASASAQRRWKNAVKNGLAFEEKGEDEYENGSARVTYNQTVTVDVQDILDGDDLRRVVRTDLEEEMYRHASEAASDQGIEFEIVDDVEIRSWDYAADSENTVHLRGDVVIDVVFDFRDGSDTTVEIRTPSKGTIFTEYLGDEEEREKVILDEYDVDAAISEYEKENFDPPSVAYRIVDGTRVENLQADERWANVDVAVAARIEGRRKIEGKSNYAYPVRKAIAAGLIVDVTPGLRRGALEGQDPDDDWLRDLKIDDVKQIILNLDLREVTDREALQFFQKLIEDTGASWEEQSRFLRETSLYHRERMTDLFGMPDPDGALRAAGYRVNPDEDSFESVGEQIYGALAHLDD